MKKIIISFTAGQLLQLLVLWVGSSITYEANLLPLCAALGIVVTLALVIGAAGSMLELSYPQDPTDDADDEILKKGPPITEWPTIFKRGEDKREKET